MKTRMWVVETDQYGATTDRKFFVNDPTYIHRVGEFVDGYNAGGWVSHVQWNYVPFSTSDDSLEERQSTVYVYLKEKKDG